VIEVSLGSFGTVAFASLKDEALAAPSSSEMARLDAVTISGGTPSLELMERAGVSIADYICRLLETRGGKTLANVLVLCGPGNNGGDGLVVSRVLAERGYQVSAVIAQASRYSDDCLEQVQRFRSVSSLLASQGTSLPPFVSQINQSSFDQMLGSATVVVDALLGTGQRDAPRGEIGKLVSLLMEAKGRRPELLIVSADIPTGVDADCGAVFVPHISADYTVSIELVKRGMMQFPARSACGVVTGVPIGIDERSDVAFSLALGANLEKLSLRAPDAHKGVFGRVLIVGGSAAMPGASALAALGALRAGVPLVTRATRSTWLSPEIPPECMHTLIPGDGACYTDEDCSIVLAEAQKVSTVVIGPGLGRDDRTGAFVKGVLEGLSSQSVRVVCDADALFHIARLNVSLTGLDAVITPHPGEAATMLGTTTDRVQADRFSAVQALQQRYGCVALLKGAGTLVYDGGRGFIVPRGTPYLATGGSGDVLSGIIAACMGRVSSTRSAAVVAAYIHAVAGERAAERTGGPIIATDIAWAAASVIGEFERA
jgi:NAD(P)H-hydrate epimerase